MSEGTDLPAVCTVLLRGVDPGELAELWRVFEIEGTESARNKVAVHYQPLLRFAARRIMLGLPALASPRHLMNAGARGLLAAVEEFDAASETSFEAFAMPRIRASIIEALRTHNAVPHLWEWQWHHQQVETELEHLLGRKPTGEEAEPEIERRCRQRPVMIAVPDSTIDNLDALWPVRDADTTRVSMLDPFPEGKAYRLNQDHSPTGWLTTLLNETETERPTYGGFTHPRDWIGESLTGLKERDRLLAWLFFRENMRVLDIGGLLGIGSGIIPRYVGQAVLTLRRNLGTLTGSRWRHADDPEQLIVLP